MNRSRGRDSSDVLHLFGHLIVCRASLLCYRRGPKPEVGAIANPLRRFGEITAADVPPVEDRSAIKFGAGGRRDAGHCNAREGVIVAGKNYGCWDTRLGGGLKD